jgi:hypothetical protein
MSLNLTGTTEFKLNVTPKIMTFTDTTDYSGQSVNPSDAKGCLTITGPTGTIYNNTNFGSPDILPGTTDFFDRNLPLNTSSEVVQGDYSVQYRVRVDNNITANITGTSIITVVGSDVSALFTTGTSFQITTGSSIGTYTVASSSFVGTDTIINIEESALLENGVNILVYSYSTQNFNYNYCYGAPVVDIEAQVDCDCSKIVSRDLTNYNIQACGTTLIPTSMLRVHTVSAPEGADGLPVAADVVSNLATITVTPIWTKTWTTSIQTTLTYTLPSGLLVTMVASGQTEYVVDCAEGLCCVYACMANLRNTYERFLTTNPVRAVEFFPKVFKMTTAWMLYSVAHTCGDFANKRKYLDEIIDIAKSANCDCCNGADDLVPVEIVPVCGTVSGGSGNTTIVTTCGNGITITPTTVGSTTTYQVCIDLTVLNQNIADYLLANPLALGDLSNVTIVSPDVNQVLVWNGTAWVNGSIPLGALSNVTAGSPGTNQFLMWNGVNWVPADAPVTYSKAFLIDSFTTAQTLSATGAFTDLDVQLALATGNNALSVNGEVVECEALFTLTSAVSPLVGFALNGTVVGTLTPFAVSALETQVRARLTLTRVSATSLFYRIEYGQFNVGESSAINSSKIYYGTVAVADITATGLGIAPWCEKTVLEGNPTCVYSNYKAFKK